MKLLKKGKEYRKIIRKEDRMKEVSKLEAKIQESLENARSMTKVTNQYEWDFTSELDTLITKLEEFLVLVKRGHEEEAAFRIMGICRFVSDWMPNDYKWDILHRLIFELEETADEFIGRNRLYPELPQELEKKELNEVRDELNKIISLYGSEPLVIGQPTIVDGLVSYWKANLGKEDIILKEIIAWLECGIPERLMDALHFLERIPIGNYLSLAPYVRQELTKIETKWSKLYQEGLIDYEKKIQMIRKIIDETYKIR